ncbi:MAG: NAD+ synthase, partial [Nitrososphaerales archaeon]
THSRLGQNLRPISRKIERFISEYVKRSSAKGLVIGLSGGLDSSVVLKLCVNAIGPDKVLGLVMPSRHTPQEDIRDATELAETLKVRYEAIDIDPIIERFAQVLPEDKRAMGNLAARVRMSILYYNAAINGYLVVGTSDKSERETGFFTKFGDGVADMLPIADFYKTQVRPLARYLKLPASITEKKSSPRLWENHLAEKEIGMSYETIDPILHLLVDKKKKPEYIARKLKVPLKDVQKAKEMVDKSVHKRNPTPYAKLR